MNFSVFNEFVISIILGLVQGITEFLPISSTAHVRLVSGLLANGRDIGLTASNIIQFGTLLAILVYFRTDLATYFRRIGSFFGNKVVRAEFVYNFITWWRGDADFQGKPHDIESDITISQLAIGTVPLLILGYFLHNFAESSREFNYIATFLLAGSVLMAFAEWQHRQALAHPEANLDRPKYISRGEVILIGLFQTLAAFPGISRSGATLSGALMLGRDRAKSVRFSFLLSIPSLLLLSVYDLLNLLKDIHKNGLHILPQADQWTSTGINLSLVTLIVAFALSYFAGLACLRWLLKYLSQHTFRNFIIYRVGLAILLLVLLATKLI